MKARLSIAILMSVIFTTLVQGGNVADINKDGRVDWEDFSLTEHWLK